MLFFYISFNPIAWKYILIVSGEYPWQAALLKKEQYDNVYVCGGSLIDNTHLITAAHCITQYRYLILSGPRSLDPFNLVTY